MRLTLVCLVLGVVSPLLLAQSPGVDLYEGMSIAPKRSEASAGNAALSSRESSFTEVSGAKVASFGSDASAKAAPPKEFSSPNLIFVGQEDIPELPVFEPQESSLEQLALQTNDFSACQIDRVLLHTNKRLQEFVRNVNRISAIELLDHERFDKTTGKRKEHERRKYNYVVVLQEFQPGKLSLEEFRDGVAGNSVFPGEVATMGMPGLALIFHPYHRGEFEMNCDSLSTWHDHRVWQVHFSQRRDAPARMSSLRTGGKSYSVLLKGTAWVDAENFQIIHLETDLLQPIPEARLLTEHQSLDYGPVHFTTKNVTLWLPQQADILLDSNGKRYHHKHTFSNYQMFSVDYTEQVDTPSLPTASP